MTTGEGQTCLEVCSELIFLRGFFRLVILKGYYCADEYIICFSYLIWVYCEEFTFTFTHLSDAFMHYAFMHYVYALHIMHIAL